MSLPKRKPKADKPDARWRSPAHRRWITTEFCCAVCGRDAPIEAAHVSMGAISGTGLKSDDWNCVPLCGTSYGHEGCHQRQHSVGEKTFWLEYALKERQTVFDLIASLCKASPKSAEITRIKRERGE